MALAPTNTARAELAFKTLRVAASRGRDDSRAGDTSAPRIFCGVWHLLRESHTITNDAYTDTS